MFVGAAGRGWAVLRRKPVRALRADGADKIASETRNSFRKEIIGSCGELSAGNVEELSDGLTLNMLSEPESNDRCKHIRLVLAKLKLCNARRLVEFECENQEKCG
ncbi:unnamed protein product [Protopolystoma xenopodis]|uniref:Uncharacterized protein n=1 Tax=Protopolystoma xenopodis TaxID=117903 RepID=A0A3S5CT56_9PLAT|nr:unnamed protein product [Protopolystoma xenopodis]